MQSLWKRAFEFVLRRACAQQLSCAAAVLRAKMHDQRVRVFKTAWRRLVVSTFCACWKISSLRIGDVRIEVALHFLRRSRCVCIAALIG